MSHTFGCALSQLEAVEPFDDVQNGFVVGQVKRFRGRRQSRHNPFDELVFLPGLLEAIGLGERHEFRLLHRLQLRFAWAGGWHLNGGLQWLGAVSVFVASSLSPSLALPELMPATAVAPSGSDSLVELVEADSRQWPALQPSPHSTPTLQLAPQEWRLELEGIGWFRATGGERLEWQRWDDSVSDRDIRTFAVTSGLGALAIQRGALVLHGTALERDGEAILLLGHPAAGKSTLAWCLLQEGWHLLSSELVAVGSDGIVQPGMHQLKLWYDAAMTLELDYAQLQPVRKGLKRYALLAEELTCMPQPTPLPVSYTHLTLPTKA